MEDVSRPERKNSIAGSVDLMDITFDSPVLKQFGIHERRIINAKDLG